MERIKFKPKKSQNKNMSTNVFECILKISNRY